VLKNNFIRHLNFCLLNLWCCVSNGFRNVHTLLFGSVRWIFLWKETASDKRTHLFHTCADLCVWLYLTVFSSFQWTLTLSSFDVLCTPDLKDWWLSFLCVAHWMVFLCGDKFLLIRGWLWNFSPLSQSHIADTAIRWNISLHDVVQVIVVLCIGCVCLLMDNGVTVYLKSNVNCSVSVRFLFSWSSARFCQFIWMQ
jgi:hypothetical protein